VSRALEAGETVTAVLRELRLVELGMRDRHHLGGYGS
jgi:hypothetical protein